MKIMNSVKANQCAPPDLSVGEKIDKWLQNAGIFGCPGDSIRWNIVHLYPSSVVPNVSLPVNS